MDLAEQIDDFIPSVQTSRSDMDSLIMLVFVVTIVTLILAFLVRLAYQKFMSRRNAEPVETTPATKTATKPLPQKTETDANTQSVASAVSAPVKVSPFNRPTARDVTRPMPVSKSRSLSQQSLTTGVRKRLSRASPGPELQQNRSSRRNVSSPENINGVDETIVLWINQVFKWLYSDLVIVNDLLFGFISAINQSMGRNSEDTSEVMLEIVRILPESLAPTITNVFCDKSLKSVPSEVSVSMDLETTLILQLKAFRQKAGKTEILHYRATIRLKGHLSVQMNYGTLVGELRMEGYPDVKITIASIGPIKSLSPEDKDVQNSVVELLNLSIRESIYPIDFSMHATCPRAFKMEPENIYDNRGMQFPSPYDLMDMNMNHATGNNGFMSESPSRFMPQQQMMQANRRLLVKIVKGEGLTYAKDAFVSVEMDEPPQKNQTGARHGKDPLWDEHFLFDLSNASSEILFEVYDRPDVSNGFPKFLGLGLVGIDELSVGIASSQIISLQPRPYETDDVSGAITVEFVFIEGAQIPTGRRPYKLKEALKMNNVQHVQDQNNFYEQPLNDNQWHQQIDGEKNMNHHSLSPRSTSSSLRNESNNPLRTINYSSQNHIVASTNGDTKNLEGLNKKYNTSSSPRTMTHLTPNQATTTKAVTPDRSTLNMKISMIQKENSAEPQSPSSINDVDISESRGREKKRSGIFGTLKKRLSRSRTRKDDKINGNEDYEPKPSSTTNNSTATNRFSGTFSRLSLPISRKSSFSEASAISNSSRMSSISAKTFLHEASTLVLEVVENGVTRHYLVPMSVAQKPRWRRKGIKMHIYNDHTFIAKHLTSGLICEICLQAIPFRMGKQGYECRDCLLKCHKQCHVRTSQLCPKPTIQSIELCKFEELTRRFL